MEIFIPEWYPYETALVYIRPKPDLSIITNENETSAVYADGRVTISYDHWYDIGLRSDFEGLLLTFMFRNHGSDIKEKAIELKF